MCIFWAYQREIQPFTHLIVLSTIRVRVPNGKRIFYNIIYYVTISTLITLISNIVPKMLVCPKSSLRCSSFQPISAKNNLTHIWYWLVPLGLGFSMGKRFFHNIIYYATESTLISSIFKMVPKHLVCLKTSLRCASFEPICAKFNITNL